MKRLIVLLLAAALMLGGCAAAQDDPYRVDTVVRIPVNPTEAPTEPPETQVQITEPPAVETEAATEPPTQPKETTSTSTGKSNSGKSSTSSKNQTGTKTETPPPATEPEVTAPPPTEAPFDPSSYDVGSLEYGILDELNAYRTAEGEGTLSISSKLSGIAALRAREGKRSWSHTRPDGRSYSSALSDYGYGYSDVTELMVHVSGSGDAASIAAKWLDSDSHSANIRSSSFSKAGIGVYRSGGMTYVVCLLVG